MSSSYEPSPTWVRSQLSVMWFLLEKVWLCWAPTVSPCRRTGLVLSVTSWSQPIPRGSWFVKVSTIRPFWSNLNKEKLCLPFWPSSQQPQQGWGVRWGVRNQGNPNLTQQPNPLAPPTGPAARSSLLPLWQAELVFPSRPSSSHLSSCSLLLYAELPNSNQIPRRARSGQDTNRLWCLWSLSESTFTTKTYLQKLKQWSQKPAMGHGDCLLWIFYVRVVTPEDLGVPAQPYRWEEVEKHSFRV